MPSLTQSWRPRKIAKVFELMLGETERGTTKENPEPAPSKCDVM